MSTIVDVNPPNKIEVTAVSQNEYNVSINSPSTVEVTVAPIGIPGPAGPQGPDLIMEANGATAETAAFSLGAKIVIRTDLI